MALFGRGPSRSTPTFTDPGVVDLVAAAVRGARAEVDRLRGRGVAIDARGRFGMTPLVWSAAAGNDPGVATLLGAGADPTLGSDNGSTALHWAAECPSTSTLQTLLDHGVPVATRNVRDGSSALKNAIMNDRPRNVTFLLRQGLAAGTADDHGDTPLHVAARINRAGLVLQLMAAGADPTAVNRQGVTFQTYLFMTPEKVRSAAFRRGIERVREELRRRGIPIEGPC